MELDWIRTLVIAAVPAVGVVIWMARWFGKHGEWVKGMDEFKLDTKKALAEIRDDINEMRHDIKKLLSAQPRNVLAGTSPLQLTDLGEDVSKRVGAVAWAMQAAPRLADQMRGMNAYEIQEFCMDYMRNGYQRTPEQDQSFKECAYENGIKLEQVLDVCAVVLRDRLLRLSDFGHTD